MARVRYTIKGALCAWIISTLVYMMILVSPKAYLTMGAINGLIGAIILFIIYPFGRKLEKWVNS